MTLIWNKNMKKSELRNIIKEEIQRLHEGWLPSEFKGSLPSGLVGVVSKKLDYEPTLVYAFCVALLEDVNDHPMAKKINDIFDKELG